MSRAAEHSQGFGLLSMMRPLFHCVVEVELGRRAGPRRLLYSCQKHAGHLKDLRWVSDI